eukprot:TRINITY_DN9532_c0_g3_i1.p1 TRINITY_DN9532_c0_g3~~TRINITY_DN9532_c0_g3_i1.p1  ORF type:complete len:733 (-),score=120.92 TRINITY_DN9532_c0_g3_i1:755-2953(-)
MDGITRSSSHSMFSSASSGPGLYQQNVVARANDAHLHTSLSHEAIGDLLPNSPHRHSRTPSGSNTPTTVAQGASTPIHADEAYSHALLSSTAEALPSSSFLSPNTPPPAPSSSPLGPLPELAKTPSAAPITQRSLQQTLTPNQLASLRSEMATLLPTAFVAFVLSAMVSSINLARERPYPISVGQISILTLYSICSALWFFDNHRDIMPSSLIRWLTPRPQFSQGSDRAMPGSDVDDQSMFDRGSDDSHDIEVGVTNYPSNGRGHDQRLHKKDTPPQNQQRYRRIQRRAHPDDASSGWSVHNFVADIGQRLSILIPHLESVMFAGSPLFLLLVVTLNDHAYMKSIQNADFFFFVLGMTLVYSMTYLDRLPTTQPLHSEMLYEWKGWMHIVFLAYHYFHTSMVYNYIRVIVAAYLWIATYGHVENAMKKGYYSVAHVLRILFRINFQVFVVCLATNTQYMLYYMCALHSFWFLATYFMMGIFHQHNRKPMFFFTKVGLLAFGCIILSEIPYVADMVFYPFSSLLDFGEDGLEEWKQRLWLDRYGPIFGIVCGYFSTSFQTWLVSIENKGSTYELQRKVPITAAIVILGYVFGAHFLTLDPAIYRNWHTFVAIIPIVCYVWLRNIHPTVRSYNIKFFSWWGKYSLESYVYQFHLLLARGTKFAVVMLPSLPYSNFLVSVIVLLLAATMVYRYTSHYAEALFPDDHYEALYNLCRLLTMMAGIYSLANLFMLFIF